MYACTGCTVVVAIAIAIAIAIPIAVAVTADVMLLSLLLWKLQERAFLSVEVGRSWRFVVQMLRKLLLLTPELLHECLQ